MTLRWISGDAGATRRIGERFAETLRGGDVVVLAGDLGAGKTTFTQGVATGLGVTQAVTSPTFVLAREYPLAGGGRFVHADAYRLDSLGELEDLVEDLLGDDAITLVEWGDVVADELGKERYIVRLGHADGGGRSISIDASSDRLRARLDREIGSEIA